MVVVGGWGSHLKIESDKGILEQGWGYQMLNLPLFLLEVAVVEFLLWS